MALDRQKLVGFLLETVRELASRSGAPAKEITGATCIFGKEGIFSSLEIVELMLSVEDFCRSNGQEFTWTNDSAMSGERSPYRSIDILADFICAQQVTK